MYMWRLSACLFVWFGGNSLYFIYMYVTIQVSGYVQYMSSVCKDVSCVCYLFTNSNNNKGVMAGQRSYYIVIDILNVH